MNKTTLSIAPRKTPAQGRAKDKVHRILTATAELLAVKTGERITTNHIAIAAGVNVATLYQYFPNKQAIFYALFCEWLDRSTSRYDQIEKQYFLKVGWKEFFTLLRLSNEQDTFSAKSGFNLDRLMYSDESLLEMDRLYSEQIAVRMAGYLKGYGSKWSKSRLINLSYLIDEISWAAIYRYSQQPEREIEQTREWSIISAFILIEHCLE